MNLALCTIYYALSTITMLLRFFRSTGSQMLLFIPLLAVLLWLHPIISPPGHIFFFSNYPMPLYQIILHLLPGNSFAGTFLTLLIVIIQGFLLVRLNTRFIFINNRSYLPAFFFVILTASVYNIQKLNPVIFAGFFILLALEKLFESFRNEKLSYEIFTASFFISIGALFYPFVIFYIIFIWISIYLLRPFNWREWVFTVLGLFTPFILIDSYYFLIVNNTHIVLNGFINSFKINHDSFQFRHSLISLIIYIILLLIISSQYLIQSFQGKKILQRKAFTLFFWLFFTTLAIYIFLPQASVELIYFLAIPLSYLFANYFVFIRSPYWGNILLLLLFVLVIWNQISG